MSVGRDENHIAPVEPAHIRFQPFAPKTASHDRDGDPDGPDGFTYVTPLFHIVHRPRTKRQTCAWILTTSTLCMYSMCISNLKPGNKRSDAVRAAFQTGTQQCKPYLILLELFPASSVCLGPDGDTLWRAKEFGPSICTCQQYIRMKLIKPETDHSPSPIVTSP